MLVRHGQSEWNLKNLFTGWRDVDLAPKGDRGGARGRQDTEGERLHVRHLLHLGAHPRPAHPRHHARRARPDGPADHKDQALNERDYGDLVGLNKDDARTKWGEEQVHVWRRSYATAPPGGELLRDTGARVWPYYLNRIQPHVLRGEKVLISAHGNSLRALIMALDGLTPDEVVKLELATGVPVVYRLNGPVARRKN